MLYFSLEVVLIGLTFKLVNFQESMLSFMIWINLATYLKALRKQTNKTPNEQENKTDPPRKKGKS